MVNANSVTEGSHGMSFYAVGTFRVYPVKAHGTQNVPWLPPLPHGRGSVGFPPRYAGIAERAGSLRVLTRASRFATPAARRVSTT